MHNIAAMTFHFDAVEDRILLVGNLHNQQPRNDFWLTRNLTLKMLEALQALLQKTSEQVSTALPQHQSEVASFEHDQARQGMQLEPEPDMPEKSAACLLYKVDISHSGQRYQLRLFLQDEEQAAAQILLTHEELHQVLSLLHRGARELEWGVDPKLFPGGPLAEVRVLQ